jgi:DNA-directed RNA polymerase specialized sigma24 family protein
MHWIDKVTKHHREWVKIVHSFGEHFFAEDIVQETYIDLLKWSSEDKLITNGKVNKGYVWLCLKNTFLQHVNKAKRITLVDIKLLENIPEHNSVEIVMAREQIEVRIKNEMDTWEWYDRMLFSIYRDNNYSMREIARTSSISLSNIFSTIKSCKAKLRENVGEDYQDYKNGDFELI